MHIKGIKSGIERHVERSEGEWLVAEGIAVEVPPAADAPKTPAPLACALRWTVTRMARSEFPCVNVVCGHCRTETHYIVDAREPWRRKEFQLRWVNGAYVKEFGGAANFYVWHRGQREVIPPAILEQVRALGIPNAETAYVGTPPLEFLAASGDAIVDQLTIQNGGKRPADPQPGRVIQYMTGQAIVKDT